MDATAKRETTPVSTKRTPPARQRRWNHQMWRDGPREMKIPTSPVPASALTPAPRDVQLGRAKLFMPTRGTCMTPSIRAIGPSYMKPVSTPVQPSRCAVREDEPPLAIVRTVASRQEIVAVSNQALRFGIRPGLTLTEGKALCSKLAFFDHDPLRDGRALEALARWMTRFTPIVCLPLPYRGFPCTHGRWKGRGEGEASELSRRATSQKSPSRLPRSPLTLTLSPAGERGSEQDAIYLDITGCARVFGGVGNIVRGVIDALRNLHIDAGVAAAPTPGAAWALASFGEDGCIIPPDDLRAALAPLPVAGLRLDDDVAQSLRHLGLETIGQVMNVPRDAMPARFGPTLLMRLDQALGRVAEPLVPLPYRTPVEARMDFDGPVESLETIWQVYKVLIGQVIEELIRRGCGARKVEVEFFRADKKIVRHAIALSRPSRDPVNLFNLIRCATENVDGGDDGFLGVRLHVVLAERVDDEQIALLDHERYAGEIELAQLVERLSVRLGEDALARPTLVESHVPERAFSWLGFSTRAESSRTKTKARVENPCHESILRPLQLLPNPIEIGVMVSPSDDRDGRPILFRNGNDVHQLTHTIGPERIAGEWWRGHDRTRDYFDVEDEEGKRFWLFRVNETNKWYVHGFF